MWDTDVRNTNDKNVSDIAVKPQVAYAAQQLFDFSSGDFSSHPSHNLDFEHR